MVMDATQPQQPSPQSVGREFVRQYYTLLNKAPNHLHRFYNNNSSFIHGESTLVVGQKNIHNRIQQLNFHDCHAKISQVDAQATLGNGVVVQVTGELSNDGQPMRRFTQTFVLAAQSPKKYYVHNDIFRYQDMYSDEENDGESRSENDEELHEQQPITTSANEQQPLQQQTQVGGGVGPIVEQQQQQLPAQLVAATTGIIPQAAAPQQQQAAIYYSLPSAGVRPVPVLAAPRTGAGVPLAAQFACSVGGPPPQVQAAPLSGAQLNGVAHDDLLSAGNGIMLQQQQQPLVAQTSSPNVVQSAVTAVPVATPVLSVSAASIPVANAAAIPQNAAGINVTVSGNAGVSSGGSYHQAPLLQQQQQLLQQQQPTPPNLMQVQSQQQQTIASNDEDVVSGTTPISMNDAPTRVTPSATTGIETSVGAAPPVIDDFKTINEQQQQEKYEAAKQQQNEPKTYANLFKSSSSSPSGFVNAAMQQQQQLQQQQSASNPIYQQSTSTISTATFSQSNSSTSSSSVYNPNRNDNSTLRMENNTQGQSGPLPQRTNTARVNKDFDQRRTSNPQQFGDNQQLFLGNVPHHATEDDLKAIFSRFGSVVELRILSKPGSKLPPGARNPLNYGFITYDDPESVQNCLANCPLYFPENVPDAQKLNVEEKKPRMRSDLPPRQSMGSNMNNNMGGNNQRNNMSGGPPSRSLSNTGGGASIMRNNSNTGGGGNSGMQRGSSGGPRMGGGFNRNENRGGPSSGGPPSRSGNGGGSNNSSQSGGGGYGGRR